MNAVGPRKLTDEEASQKEREIRAWLASNHADKPHEDQEIIGAIRYLELTGDAPRWSSPAGSDP